MTHYYHQPKTLRTNLFSQLVWLVLLLAIVFSLVPARAHAQFGLGGLLGGVGGADRVQIVGDSSDTGRRNLLANEAARASQDRLIFKELTLDGIAWSLVKNISQQMTSSIINWINSGFKGSPAFVTDLNRFLLDVADQTAGEFIYGSELGFLCEPIEFQVRVALEAQYRRADRDTYEPLCTLSEVADNIDGFLNGDFRQGGWPAFFELTVGSNNDPNKAFFNAYAELQSRVGSKQAEETKLLEFGSGLFSMKVCDTVYDTNGQPRQECEITTPGKVIEGALTFEVGEKGSLTLLQADEFNEIVSALLSQLATQALSGANGLLGLGGNSRYSNNSFGSNGNQSYLAALAAEDISSRQDLSNNEINDAVVAESVYAAMQQEIIDTVTELEDALAEGETDYPGCFDLELTSDLESIKEDAESNLDISNSTLATLQNINNVFLNSPASQKMEVLNVFNTLKDSDALRTESQNEELRVTFIEGALAAIVADFEDDIDDEIDNCN